MSEVAVVVGVGPGLGWALCRTFAHAGIRVAGAARNKAAVEKLAAAEPALGIAPYACDVTDGESVRALFEAVATDLGEPTLVASNAGAFIRAPVLDLDPAELEQALQVSVMGALHVAQAAGRRMVAAGRGTIIFTGATAALRGSAGFAGLAVGKFGQRALAQSLARELGPRGVHVVHVIIDGLILSERTRPFVKPGTDTALDPDDIARTYLDLHRQRRSAWPHELDLRPWVEKF